MKRLLLSVLFAITAFSSPLTYQQALDDAISEVSQLDKNLSRAEKSSKKTKAILATTVVELSQAEIKLDMLQQQIDAETKELNKQITLAQEYQEKYNKAEEKLNWWRKLAALVSVAGVGYVVVLILKATGRL